MSRFHDDAGVRAAAEQCAERETWLRLESNPAERQRIEQALRQAQAKLAREVERAGQQLASIFTPDSAGRASGARMFPQGNVTDIFKALDERAARARADADARHAIELAAHAEPPPAAPIEPHPVEVERETARLGEELQRELRAPPEIRDLPDWAELHAASLQEYGNVIAGGDGPELASAPLPAGPDFDQVPELAAGESIEGDILAIIERDGASFYVIEADDGHQAAAAVELDGPEFEAGDTVTASRDDHGNYEIEDDYGYGR
jgi:hypothetical protein